MVILGTTEDRAAEQAEAGPSRLPVHGTLKSHLPIRSVSSESLQMLTHFKQDIQSLLYIFLSNRLQRRFYCIRLSKACICPQDILQKHMPAGYMEKKKRIKTLTNVIDAIGHALSCEPLFCKITLF